ncbi:stress transcription factor A [Seminavis robusta]|uniref:Stress transcription factor A n=1 Tax=Seminavis robusta TaxID=568900 RepID=A0A9N8E7L3_9STRA|nr:stress transcription factor A [Seminavis robusta]|eukprot:Sro769_g199780.1 stress transcription factor A (318) ;mRNA; f:19612-20941
MIGYDSQEHHPQLGLFPGIDSNVSYPSQQGFDYRHCNYAGYPPPTAFAAFGEEMKGAKGEDSSFPVRLHYLLDVLQQDGLAHLASWQPHGRCFVVHNPDDFAEKVLPLWFRQSRFGSFQRQLNLYGFKRLKQGRDKGGYYHDSFLRGYPQLAHDIKRAKTKKAKSSDSEEEPGEPNFYSIPFLPITFPAALIRNAPPPPASVPVSQASKENVFAQPRQQPGQGVPAMHYMPIIHVPAAVNEEEKPPMAQQAPPPASYRDSFLELNVPLLQTKLFASPQPPSLPAWLPVASKAQEIQENVNRDDVASPSQSTTTTTTM